MSRLILIGILLIINCKIFSQNYTLIYFPNKKGTKYDISDPLSFLSQRSVDRRLKNNILIDSTDLPVSETYLELLKNKHIDIQYVSKWLNAVVTTSNVDSISKYFDTKTVKSTKAINRTNPTKKNLETISDYHSNQRISNSFYGTSFIQLNMMNVDSLHSEGITGKNILIAVLDEGFFKLNELKAFKHLMDSSKILDTYNFVDKNTNVYDDGEHGTSVMSTMAAYLPNKLIGACYNSKFLLYNTENSSSESPLEEVLYVLAAERADSVGADICTASLSYQDFDNSNLNYRYSDMNGQTTIASVAIKNLSRKGVIALNSAGNSGNSSKFKYIGTPADADSMLAVGAVNLNFEKTDFSSIGPSFDNRTKPDVSALGENVTLVNIYNDGEVSYSSGTSFSCPLVAGFTACMKQKFPDKSSQELINYIKQISSNSVLPNNLIGYGVPYYGQRSERNDYTLDIYTSTINNSIHIFNKNIINISPVNISLYDMTGKKVLELYNQNINKEVTEISISNLSKSIYFLCIHNSIINIKERIFNR
ncbi:MAG: S8 family serine peptidase [Cytophagales bacterium]